MKRLVSVVAFVACNVAFSPLAAAQDCSAWTVWDLRGTYTMSGSGYIDLSKLAPGMGLPPGLIPMSWAGAHTYNGAGAGDGWVTVNAAGTQFSAKFVGLKYSLNADCSIQASFSMKVAELGGATVGPITRVLVPVFKPGATLWLPPALELHMIAAGTAPGTPGSAGVDLGVAYRISMKY